MNAFSYEHCLSFLNQSPLPWIRYNLKKEIGFESDKEAASLLSHVINDTAIQTWLSECLLWPEPPLVRHNDAKHPIHKISLLIDLGLDATLPEIRQIVDQMMANQSSDGAFLSTLKIPSHFGGDDQPHLQWMTCDFPVVLYNLIALGYENEPPVKKGIDCLGNICDENGWRCKSSIPKFRGPGRKTDHCPYGNLVALKAFCLLPNTHQEPFIKNAIDQLTGMWHERGQKKYFLFGIGTDFQKLKFPSLWFEIIHVMRILSYYDYAKQSSAYQELLDIILNKQQPDGGFIPESIYMAFKGWDFGQKKISSPTLTLAIKQIFDRSE